MKRRCVRQVETPCGIADCTFVDPTKPVKVCAPASALALSAQSEVSLCIELVEVNAPDTTARSSVRGSSTEVI